MSQTSVASKTPADTKPGAPRRQSAMATPYYNLPQSIEVARVIHQRAGGQCDRAQLSAMLGYTGVKNGSFLTRVTSAKLFGLIEQKDEQVPTLSVTELGKRIVAPVTDADVERAKVDAFLRVALFKRVYEEYRNGAELPPKAGLRNLFISTYEILPDRAGPAVDVLLESAAEAGFFKVGGQKRLVAPIIASVSGGDERKGAAALEADDRRSSEGGNVGGPSGNFAGDLSGIHPAIVGLLRNLPSRMTAAKRTALIAAFTATVNWVYPDPDDGTMG